MRLVQEPCKGKQTAKSQHLAEKNYNYKPNTCFEKVCAEAFSLYFSLLAVSVSMPVTCINSGQQLRESNVEIRASSCLLALKIRLKHLRICK